MVRGARCRFGKLPDARRFPDDTRRAPQPNRELQAFGKAESNLGELRGRKAGPKYPNPWRRVRRPGDLRVRYLNQRCPSDHNPLGGRVRGKAGLLRSRFFRMIVEFRISRAFVRRGIVGRRLMRGLRTILIRWLNLALSLFDALMRIVHRETPMISARLRLSPQCVLVSCHFSRSGGGPVRFCSFSGGPFQGSSVCFVFFQSVRWRGSSFGFSLLMRRLLKSICGRFSILCRCF
jgi:hypothetical protein